MFLSVVILGRFTTETHAMALYISADTPPLLTPHPGTLPYSLMLGLSGVGLTLLRLHYAEVPGALLPMCAPKS